MVLGNNEILQCCTTSLFPMGHTFMKLIPSSPRPAQSGLRQLPHRSPTYYHCPAESLMQAEQKLEGRKVKRKGRRKYPSFSRIAVDEIALLPSHVTSCTSFLAAFSTISKLKMYECAGSQRDLRDCIAEFSIASVFV